MKRLFLILAAALVVVPLAVSALGVRINSGCRIAPGAVTAISTSSDTDCKWLGNTVLELQCDAAAYVARGGETATANHQKIAVGDPYPVKAAYTDEPFSILSVSGTANCEFYRVP